MSVNGQKLGLGLGMGFDIPFAEQINAIAQTGFDAIFSEWSEQEPVKAVAQCTRENGLFYQSVHAPFGKIERMWDEDESGDAFLGTLETCLADCSDANVGIMVCHVWKGFGNEDHRSAVGVDRFARLLDRAQTLGVKVAFENTEGEEYLALLWNELRDHPAFGFCIDTGHEMCYNRSRDMIGTYGKSGKLIATHINDNMGITSDKITWHDDAHLVPFDGVADWKGVTDRLKAVGYRDILTAELTVKNKPDRMCNAIYDALSFREYLALVHERLAKIAQMMAN